MARTMTANLTGARLREVDRALRDARGAPAVDALMNAYPHEAKVLQHLFDERRAGRPVPPLLRIARVMIWSDGAMEFRLVDMPTPTGGAAVPQAGASGSPGARPGFAQPGASRAPVGGRPPSAGPVRAGPGPAGPAPTGRPAWGDRRQGVGPVGGALTGTGVPRLRTAWVGGTRLDPAPRQFRRRPGEDDDTGWRDAPRAGDGWSVVRPGDALPMDPGDPPEYEVEDQTTAVDPSRVGGGPIAPAHLPSPEGDGADGSDQGAADHIDVGRDSLVGEVSDAAVSEPEELVPGEEVSDQGVHEAPGDHSAEVRVSLELDRNVTLAVASSIATEDGTDPVDVGTSGEVADAAEAEPEMARVVPVIEPTTGSVLAADHVESDAEEVGRGRDVSIAISADAGHGEGAAGGSQAPD